MKKTRKICVVTGSRAEYGLLYWLMHEIQQDPDLELQLIVTGTHLSPEFGLTYKVIEQDGFIITEKVEMLLSSDTPVGITKSLGLGIIGFADALERLRPDILVVLGDRYEILAAAQAAMIARIPMAHLHGGEVTQGAMDEAIRHSITKMSHLHFVAAEVYRKRVIQLGEKPENVFDFGAVGLENIVRLKLLDQADFEIALGFKLGKLNFLVTYHPATLSDFSPELAMDSLLKAIDCFPDAKIIFTKPNSDMSGSVIRDMIDKYTAKNPNKAVSFGSLGQIKYLSAISLVDVVIGNSSSGLIEVPAFKKPTVNIGPRQDGRLKGISVVDCDENQVDIAAAIKKVLSPNFKQNLEGSSSQFDAGFVSVKIKNILKNVDLTKIIIKKFYDLED